MFTIQVQVIRNTAHWPSTQASYTIGSGTIMEEKIPAAQIAAKIQYSSSDGAIYMSCIFLVLVGIIPGVSRLGSERVSHNTTDAQVPGGRKEDHSMPWVQCQKSFSLHV